MSHQSHVCCCHFVFVFNEQTVKPFTEYGMWLAIGAMCLSLCVFLFQGYISFFFSLHFDTIHRNWWFAIEKDETTYAKTRRTPTCLAIKMKRAPEKGKCVVSFTIDITHNKLNLHMDLEIFIVTFKRTRLHKHLTFFSSVISVCVCYGLDCNDCGCLEFYWLVFYLDRDSAWGNKM